MEQQNDDSNVEEYGVISKWIIKNLISYGNTTISKSRYTPQFENDLFNFFGKNKNKYEVIPSENDYNHLVIKAR